VGPRRCLTWWQTGGWCILTVHYYTRAMGVCQSQKVAAPRDRYQVVTKIVARSGIAVVQGWWKQADPIGGAATADSVRRKVQAITRQEAGLRPGGRTYVRCADNQRWRGLQRALWLALGCAKPVWARACTWSTIGPDAACRVWVVYFPLRGSRRRTEPTNCRNSSVFNTSMVAT
jgi:hypothetical protein